MAIIIRTLIIAGVTLFTGCAHQPPTFQGATEGERLADFFEWSFERKLQMSPNHLSYLGRSERQDELDDYSLEHQEALHAMEKEHLEILLSFDRDQLSEDERLSYDIYRYQSEKTLARWPWRHHSFLVNQMFGVQSSLPGFMMNIHKVSNEKDLQNYLARLGEFDRVFKQVVNRLQVSESRGVLPPNFIYAPVLADSSAILKGAPFEEASQEESPLLADFKSKLHGLELDDEKKQDYLNQAKRALLKSVQPGYDHLIQFLSSQKKRATRDDGIWRLPGGDEYYQHLLRSYTTLDVTPEEIHQLGLSEVKRIHSEMDQVRKQLNKKGDLKSFFAYMTSDQFYLSGDEEGRKAYKDLAKSYIDNMRLRLDEFFGRQPKADIIVKAVEPYREASAGMAFYQTPSLDGKRPGTYYVNLSNMKALPTWEAEALAYHEGIPGHHMQLTLAQELEDVPSFRRHARFTSYIEGWGLYAERFPKEFGFYKDPHSDFGRLSMELMRAARLVVDSGLHYKRWSRQQAIDYLNANLPGDPDDNRRQIDRYLVMPGQATAYKMGQLKILELRQRAQQALGSDFSLRQFHDLVLDGGGRPLEILSQEVDRFIDKHKKVEQKNRAEGQKKIRTSQPLEERDKHFEGVNDVIKKPICC